MKEEFYKLAQQHGTPLFVIDHKKIRENYRTFKKHLPRVQAYYAVKANPNKKILTLLQGEVDGVDISSGGEMQYSLQSGFKAENMSFAGPGKNKEELKKALKENIGSISIESMQELKRVQNLAAELKVQAQVSLPLLQLHLLMAG